MRILNHIALSVLVASATAEIACSSDDEVWLSNNHWTATINDCITTNGGVLGPMRCMADDIQSVSYVCNACVGSILATDCANFCAAGGGFVQELS